MSNPKQPDSGNQPDWPVLLVTAAGVAVCGGLVLLILNLIDLHMFPLGLILYVAAVVVGIKLGQMVASRLFGRPPGK
jgi:hypothetical protein